MLHLPQVGTNSINCLMKAERVKKMKIFQAHAAEDSDQEVEEEAKKDEDSSEEYVLISTLTRSV